MEYKRCVNNLTGAVNWLPESVIKQKDFMENEGWVVQDLESKTEIHNFITPSTETAPVVKKSARTK
jgi:hypothetical protein